MFLKKKGHPEYSLSERRRGSQNALGIVPHEEMQEEMKLSIMAEDLCPDHPKFTQMFVIQPAGLFFPFLEST
jgi:hypothetical protein